MEKPKDIHKGHFKRLRKQFYQAPEVCADHQVLELILTYISVRRDVNPLAHTIINACGSLKGVIESSKEDLMKIPGVTERTADYLSSFKEYFELYEKSFAGFYRPAKTAEELMNILQGCTDLYENNLTTVFVLSFDCRLLSKHNFRSNDSYEEYMRSVLKYVRTLNANKFSIAKYDKCEKFTPSFDDVVWIKNLYMSAKTLNVDIIDYIIYNDKNEKYSFRENDLFQIIDAIIYEKPNFFSTLIQKDSVRTLIFDAAKQMDAELDNNDKVIYSAFKLRSKIMVTDLFNL